MYICETDAWRVSYHAARSYILTNSYAVAIALVPWDQGINTADTEADLEVQPSS